MEAPIALQTSVLANINRDPKRQKTPYKLTDYCLYASKRDLNLPGGSYGAAAVKAIQQGRYPSWALFCYKELANNVRQGYEPKIAALVAHDAIILHPQNTLDGVKGMLIACESASLTSRTFTDDNGAEVMLQLPEIPTKIVASEDITLPLVANQYQGN